MSSWKAIDSLGPALDATKRLLSPFDLRRWVVLAVVVFFVSGVTGFDPSFNLNVAFDGDVPPFAGPGGALRPPRWMLDATGQLAPVYVLVAGLLAALVGLAAAFVGAVFEFVFVESLARRDVRIRGYAGEHLQRGTSLFLFRIVVGLVVVATGLFFALLSALTGGLFLLVLLFLTPVLLLAAAAIWLTLRLTTDFVVPAMIRGRVGVLAGWRALLPSLRAAWQQYVVYLLVRLGLGLLAAVVTGVGFTLVAIAVGIPFAVLGILGFAVLGTVATPGIANTFGVAVLALFALAVVVAGTVLISVPVQCYLRYYALFVIGGVEPRFDLVGASRDGDDGGDSGSTGGRPEEFAPGADEPEGSADGEDRPGEQPGGAGGSRGPSGRADDSGEPPDGADGSGDSRDADDAA